MKVFWTREALTRLIEIEAYISLDSPETAEKFVDKLIEKSESIGINSKIGRIVPEISISTIREVIFKGYRIVYRIKNSSIEILTVFEGHKLLKKKEILHDIK